MEQGPLHPDDSGFGWKIAAYLLASDAALWRYASADPLAAHELRQNGVRHAAKEAGCSVEEAEQAIVDALTVDDPRLLMRPRSLSLYSCSFPIGAV